MIHVEPQPEPPDFDARVRQPGLRALAEGRMPECWRACLDDLCRAYGRICAYLCVLIPPGTGARSVDHLASKSRRPELAYEWTNYRLVCSLMNARKREFEDVLDPFQIPDGWFVLELSFLQVLPNPQLEAGTKAQVEATIRRLKLNDKECRDARALWYDAYLAGDVTFTRLEQWSPFVAKELRRQGRVP